MDCPYCGEKARLIDSAEVYGGRSYGLMYVCKPCDARVGVHKGTKKPLGRLANAELRAAKIAAHAAFDPLWKSGRMSRNAAYRWLSEAMELSAKDCHIGMFDVADCRRVVDLCRMKKVPQ
jgi:hypothetical protein